MRRPMLVPETAASVLPHVVLMDVRMPAKSGMEATRDLLASQPGIRVVMLTGSLTGGSLHEAMPNGAVGYLLKGGPPNELVNAVRAVAAEWDGVALRRRRTVRGPVVALILR